ncbi:hypothetical protein ACFVY4_32825 [Streptomyces sp. NPDC058299]|uniref:hypothetical protein n=1 Tax=Streptomyces sp. NPDC058299 TaxID=3346435 RepID=UPI0036E34D01
MPPQPHGQAQQAAAQGGGVAGAGRGERCVVTFQAACVCTTEQAMGKAVQAAGYAVGSHKLIPKGDAAEAAGNARESEESLKDTGRH